MSIEPLIPPRWKFSDSLSKLHGCASRLQFSMVDTNREQVVSSQDTAWLTRWFDTVRCLFMERDSDYSYCIMWGIVCADSTSLHTDNDNQPLWHRKIFHSPVRKLSKEMGRKNYNYYSKRSWDSSVVLRWATSWMTGGLNPARSWGFFSLPPRPDQLWVPPSLLSNGYQELFPWG
jgi:hypothetical protein